MVLWNRTVLDYPVVYINIPDTSKHLLRDIWTPKIYLKQLLRRYLDVLEKIYNISYIFWGGSFRKLFFADRAWEGHDSSTPLSIKSFNLQKKITDVLLLSLKTKLKNMFTQKCCLEKKGAMPFPFKTFEWQTSLLNFRMEPEVYDTTLIDFRNPVHAPVEVRLVVEIPFTTGFIDPREFSSSRWSFAGEACCQTSRGVLGCPRNLGSMLSKWVITYLYL